jgi:hypothetical protein
MLCRVCHKIFSNPKGLARAIKENNNVTGVYRNTLAEFELAARGGCDVCALLSTHLSHYPGARNFSCGLGTGNPAIGFAFFVDFYVDGEEYPARLNFRLYEANDGMCPSQITYRVLDII